MSIGENIKNKRLSMGITQKELAEKVMVDQSMICQIERGSKIPTMLLGKEIASVLRCELADLLE